MKLLSNIPIEDLTPENDYLGIIEKGDMIASLLKSGNINFEEIKMFALYGNWGSGKSTLMKYLQKELKDEFNTFYFDAWKYENGKDLSYSLLEFLGDTGIDSVTIQSQQTIDSVQLYSMQSTEIIVNLNSANSFTVENVASGLYLVQISSGNRINTKKLMVR